MAEQLQKMMRAWANYSVRVGGLVDYRDEEGVSHPALITRVHEGFEQMQPYKEQPVDLPPALTVFIVRDGAVKDPSLGAVPDAIPEVRPYIPGGSLKRCWLPMHAERLL